MEAALLEAEGTAGWAGDASGSEAEGTNSVAYWYCRGAG